jgi:hypothetical protein
MVEQGFRKALGCPEKSGFFADVAQLVEQCFRKARVGGSSPLVGFKFFGIASLG